MNGEHEGSEYYQEEDSVDDSAPTILVELSAVSSQSRNRRHMEFCYDTVDAAVASPVEDEDPEVTLINSIDHYAFTPALLKRREYRCNPYFARVGCIIEVFWYVDNEFYSAEVLQNNITALVVKFEIDQKIVDIYLANTIWYIKEPPSRDHPNPSCQEELTSRIEALQLYKANKDRCNVNKFVVNATFLYYEAFYGNWRRGTVKKVKDNYLFSVLDGIGPETHHRWCPYFYIWYFDVLKKYDLGSKRSNPSSSITSIVAVSVGSSITSGTDVLDNKRLRTSQYGVMNNSSCNGSAPEMISKSDLNQACLASQNIEMRRLFKKVFCDGYQLPESQSERKKLYENFLNMGLFKQQELCYVQFCPGYVELPDGTSASASTITSPTLKSVAPQSNHQTCVMLSKMKNESPLVTPGLVQGTDIVFVLTSPGPYPSLDPSDYSITGEKGSGNLSSLTDLKMRCFSSVSSCCGYPAYTAPKDNKYDRSKVMQNIIESVTLFHRDTEDNNLVYRQRHGVVKDFEFVAESFARIRIINNAVSIARAAYHELHYLVKRCHTDSWTISPLPSLCHVYVALTQRDRGQYKLFCDLENAHVINKYRQKVTQMPILSVTTSSIILMFNEINLNAIKTDWKFVTDNFAVWFLDYEKSNHTLLGRKFFRNLKKDWVPVIEHQAGSVTTEVKKFFVEKMGQPFYTSASKTSVICLTPLAKLFPDWREHRDAFSNVVGGDVGGIVNPEFCDSEDGSSEDEECYDEECYDEECYDEECYDEAYDVTSSFSGDPSIIRCNTYTQGRGDI
eukprot:scaffold10478_cov38-Cyclotella_meneghiniana.AAC.2